MASEKQIKANRRNAQRSTGPKTSGGKAVSSRNALRHGVLSERAVSEYEDRKDFDALLGQLVADLAPETALECTLVERLAILIWREKRLAESEEWRITHKNQKADDSFLFSERSLALKDQHLIGRYQGMLGRQIRDTLRDLRDEQDRRLRTIEAHGGTDAGDLA